MDKKPATTIECKHFSLTDEVLVFYVDSSSVTTIRFDLGQSVKIEFQGNQYRITIDG